MFSRQWRDPVAATRRLCGLGNRFNVFRLLWLLRWLQLLRWFRLLSQFRLFSLRLLVGLLRRFGLLFRSPLFGWLRRVRLFGLLSHVRLKLRELLFWLRRFGLLFRFDRLARRRFLYGLCRCGFNVPGFHLLKWGGFDFGFSVALREFLAGQRRCRVSGCCSLAGLALLFTLRLMSCGRAAFDGIGVCNGFYRFLGVDMLGCVSLLRQWRCVDGLGVGRLNVRFILCRGGGFCILFGIRCLRDTVVAVGAAAATWATATTTAAFGIDLIIFRIAVRSGVRGGDIAGLLVRYRLLLGGLVLPLPVLSWLLTLLLRLTLLLHGGSCCVGSEVFRAGILNVSLLLLSVGIAVAVRA